MKIYFKISLVGRVRYRMKIEVKVNSLESGKTHYNSCISSIRNQPIFKRNKISWMCLENSISLADIDP